MSLEGEEDGKPTLSTTSSAYGSLWAWNAGLLGAGMKSGAAGGREGRGILPDTEILGRGGRIGVPGTYSRISPGSRGSEPQGS